VEVQLKARIHPDLEKSVRFHRNVFLFEDRRPLPDDFEIFDARKVAPFSPALFYDGSRHLQLAELSAEFADVAAARSGLKSLRGRKCIPYSLCALVRIL
jgi:hypothetical protein